MRMLPFMQTAPEQAAKSAAAVAASAPLWLPALPEHLALIAISGLAGGVSRAIAARERIWPHGTSSVVLGMIAAVFLWPVGEPILEPWIGRIDMDPVTGVMFGAYVTGLMGLALIQFLVDFTQRRTATKKEDDT